MSGVATAGGHPDLVVDLASPVPPFEQIRAAVAGLVASGGLAAGVRLPSVRQLAADLGIAPGTVQRAYTELRAAGVVSTATRRGVVVTGRPAAATAAYRDKSGRLGTYVADEAPHPSHVSQGVLIRHADADRLAADAVRFIKEARRAGAPDAAIRRAVEAALAG